MKIRKQIYAAGTILAGIFLLSQPAFAGKSCSSAGCHNARSETTPGLHTEWEKSKHGQNNVNCADCHRAEATDVDAFDHNGHTISIIVTPKDCSSCHMQEFEEFERSHHAKAAQYVPPEANSFLGQVVGGHAASAAGCELCHGSRVEIDENTHKPSKGWPNTGIGRINPDGSLGACTSCHGRHSFSVAQARTPESCSKCHIGPDHPQVEAYNESMHGIIYRAKVDEMNLGSENWVAGVDYSAAPTCITCHLGAAPGENKTHDIGERLSWNLRAKISSKKNLVRLNNGHQYDVAGEDTSSLPKVGDEVEDPTSKEEPKPTAEVTEVLTWQDRRNKMQKVCKACHTDSIINGHYRILDDLVNLYNDKFAKPVSGVMKELKESGLTTSTPFDEWIEWLWWEIWHHEGRRARSGAAMGGPDYAWWHGIYDVAKRVYMEFIPELEKVAGKPKAKELLTKYFIEGVTIDDNHEWFFGALRPSLENAVVVDLKTNNAETISNLIRLQPTTTVDADGVIDIDGVLTLMNENIRPRLMGQKVKIAAMVVSSDNTHYQMSNSNGQLSSWDGYRNLDSFLQEITLAPSQKIDILSGKFEFGGSSVTGALKIYLGFVMDDLMHEDEYLVYFSEPIELTVGG